MSIEEAERKYMNDKCRLAEMKNIYVELGAAFYGSQEDPEKIEGVVLQADGKFAAWVGRYSRYFCLNEIEVENGKLVISEWSCGGSTTGPLDLKSINNYNSMVIPSKRIVDWINF